MVDATLYTSSLRFYTEYNVGNYNRQFTLNEEIDDSRIKARMRMRARSRAAQARAGKKPRKIQVQERVSCMRREAGRLERGLIGRSGCRD